MKPSEIKISLLVKSHDEKTAENFRNSYVAQKRIVSKLSKFVIQILIAQIGDLNKDCVEISLPYTLNFPRNKRSKRVTVGSDRAGPGRVGPVRQFI